MKNGFVSEPLFDKMERLKYQPFSHEKSISKNTSELSLFHRNPTSIKRDVFSFWHTSILT
jgi:hypothetical protein